MYTATIDTGTTNTRVTIWEDKKPIHTEKNGTGVRVSSIEGTNEKLLISIRKCLLSALAKTKIHEESLSLIIASGMIGSELGICEIERVIAPASLIDLAKHCEQRSIKEVSRLQPIWFIPGIQNASGVDDVSKCELMDVMRGEEAEAFGILAKENVKGPVVLILPGSHTKYVYINENNEIMGCTTTMAGEILMELTRSSIISDSLSSNYVKKIEAKWLEAGAKSETTVGIGRAAFSVRILDLFTEATVNQKANYLLGAIIATDMKALFGSGVCKVNNHCEILIGGTTTFSEGFLHLLKKAKPDIKNIRVVDEKTQDNIAGYGAIMIMEQARACQDGRCIT